jgi:ectoine hydroxylase-related dioxygenase (phytanoyl-CoA dioxygenase family)
VSTAELYRMSDEEKYYFDLRGYLVVRAALTEAEIGACNAALDHHGESIRTRSVDDGGLARGSRALSGGSGRRELTGMLGWPAPHRQPFRDQLVHPVVVSRLNEMCGRGFRLDHGPLFIGATAGTEGHQLHGAGEPFSPSSWYHQQNGVISCRGVTVAWQLADVNEGDGGFAVVPGSHKTREPTPASVRSVEDDMGLVVQPAMQAGDVLLFAETATHGTLPWTGRGERRCVLYKFAERGAARATGRFFTPRDRFGDWTDELTETERAVMYGPGVHHGGRLPLLQSDGVTTTVRGAGA